MSIDRRMIVLAITLSAIAFVGCRSKAPTEKSETPEAKPAAEQTKSTYDENMKLTTFAYDCDHDKKWNWVVSFNEKDDTMTLFAPGNTVTLKHVRSGSGARYSDGKITYWSKGNEALIEMDGKKINCKEARGRSWIEQAKLQGYDFYAVGNEPGWNLKLNTDGIVFITNYGNQRFTFGKPKISEDQINMMTTYRAKNDDHKIEVVLRRKACSDSMSGEKFETTVLVAFDGKPLPGCGTPLH